MDSSLPSSSIHGIFQARIHEWIASSSSRGIFPIQESSACFLGVLRWQADSFLLVSPGEPDSQHLQVEIQGRAWKEVDLEEGFLDAMIGASGFCMRAVGSP